MLDLKITGGRIIDGTGSPWFLSDITISGGVIHSVGRGGRARKVIDAGGAFVSPGFVDIHTHSDGIAELPEAENLLRQGITTVISGNCGSSAMPVGETLDRIEESRPAINYATLAGLGSVRKKVMGLARRAPSGGEIARMRRLVARAMEEGAVGVSSGLFYVPGEYARAAELVELARPAAEHGGFYATHARSAGGKIFQAIREAALVGKKAGIAVEISHLKILHKKSRTTAKTVDEVLSLISSIRDDGLDITFDVHPYPATNTSLHSVIIPPSASEGGRLAERLKDSSFRNRIKNRVINKMSWVGGPGRITVSRFEQDPSLEGKTLSEIARRRKKDAVSAGMDLVAEGDPACIFHALRKEDIVKIACSPACMFASDGGVVRMNTGAVHPRNYGTFPGVFREYVREKGLLGAEDAVRKMTSFPAGKAGLQDRGLIKPGMRADLAIFHPDRFTDTAVFEKPHAFPEGLSAVIVNGKLAFDGRRVRARGGMVIRKT